MVTPGRTVADIGCDHGYVGITAILEARAQTVVACDINEGPLEAARSNAGFYKTAERMDFRLANGLEKVAPNEADVVLIAGMGGRLMADILSRGERVTKSADYMILSPQSDIPFFREYLRDNGYSILSEKLLFDEGKYYYILKAACAAGRRWEYPCQELGMLFGGYLLDGRDETLKKYLEWQKALKKEIILKIDKKANSDAARKVEAELEQIEMALRLYW